MNTPALEAGVFFCIAPAFRSPCIQHPGPSFREAFV